MANKDKKNVAQTTAPKGDDNELDEEALLAQNLAAFEAEGGEEVAGSGFPPYLKPVVGQIYRFTPVFTDARNPKFVRHNVIHRGKDVLTCATGPVEDAEPVEVKPGEMYSISDYKGIPFDDAMGLEVLAFCTDRRKMNPLPDGTARAPMFIFRFKMSPSDKAKFEERKTTRMKAQVEAMRLAAAGAHAAHVNGLPVTPSHSTPAQASLPVG